MIRYMSEAFDHHLYAFVATNGTLLWSLKLDDILISSPAFDGQTIYTGSADGWFYCHQLFQGSYHLEA
jgi:outer membrane protein assembly factor BamB